MAIFKMNERIPEKKCARLKIFLNSNNTNLLVLANIVLVIVTFFYALRTHDLVKATEVANKIIFRPYVVIENIAKSEDEKIPDSQKIIFPDFIIVGGADDQDTLAYKVRNVGKIPTRVCDYWRYVIINEDFFTFEQPADSDAPDDTTLLFPEHENVRMETLFKKLIASKGRMLQSADGTSKRNFKDKPLKITVGITVLYKATSTASELSSENYYSFVENEIWLKDGKMERSNRSDAEEGSFTDKGKIKSYRKTFGIADAIKLPVSFSPGITRAVTTGVEPAPLSGPEIRILNP